MAFYEATMPYLSELDYAKPSPMATACRRRSLAVAVCFVPGVANAVLELLPGARVTLLPGSPRVRLDGIPVLTARTVAAGQVVAVAIGWGVLIVGVAAVCIRGLEVR